VGENNYTFLSSLNLFILIPYVSFFMDSKSVLFYCTAFVFGSLMLMAITSNGISNTFEVYAANNCDSTSTCTNAGSTSDNQNNNCNGRSTCANIGLGGSNTQNNNCTRTSFCFNGGSGGSTQNNNCADPSFCANIDLVGSSTQNIDCANGLFCSNTNAGGSSTQNAACQSSSCFNVGANTNVISNSASLCTSGGSDTTTICQRDRTFVFPNH